jgi:UV DNA damage endonuclease
VEDLPACWQRKKITVEIEAKAKEVAVLKLKKELEQQGKRRTSKITQKQS